MKPCRRFTTVIVDVRKLDGEATLLGYVFILGALHHAWFVRVEERDGAQVAVDDPHHRLDDFYHLAGDGGLLDTVRVPGFEGEYVLAICAAVR